MAVKTSQLINTISQDISRGPSQGVWGDCPLEDIIQSGGGGIGTFGYMVADDFLTGWNDAVVSSNVGSYKEWGAFLGTSGHMGAQADTTNLPLEGGMFASLCSGTSQNLISHVGGGGFGFVNASSASGVFRGKMWFECSLAISSIAANSSAIFVGLVDNTSSVIGAASRLFAVTAANGLVNTNGFFGFYKPSASGITNNANPSKVLTGSLVNDFIPVYNVAAGTIQFPGSASNLWTLLTNNGMASGLAAATFTSGAITTPSTMKVKLGFVFDPTASCPLMAAPAAITANQTSGTTYPARIRMYVNGQLSGAFLTSGDIQASTFPSTWLTPVIAHEWGSSGAGVLYCDWVRVAQLGTT